MRYTLAVLALFVLTSAITTAPAPMHPEQVMVGEVTATSEGPGNHVGIQLDWKHWFTVTKATKSKVKKESTVGCFMLYGVGDSDLIAEVRYSGRRPHTHWGKPHYYAKSIEYTRRLKNPPPPEILVKGK
jgi:hypothetical protein